MKIADLVVGRFYRDRDEHLYVFNGVVKPSVFPVYYAFMRYDGLVFSFTFQGLCDLGFVPVLYKSSSDCGKSKSDVPEIDDRSGSTFIEAGPASPGTHDANTTEVIV